METSHKGKEIILNNLEILKEYAAQGLHTTLEYDDLSHMTKLLDQVTRYINNQKE